MPPHVVEEKIHSEEWNQLGIENIDKLVSIYSKEHIAKSVMALDYSKEKLELTLETQAIKAREAATKEGRDIATLRCTCRRR